MSEADKIRQLGKLYLAAAATAMSLADAIDNNDRQRGKQCAAALALIGKAMLDNSGQSRETIEQILDAVMPRGAGAAALWTDAPPVDLRPPCETFTPPEFTGPWEDWHRGSGCIFDDGKPRSEAGAAEIAALGVDHPKLRGSVG